VPSSHTVACALCVTQVTSLKKTTLLTLHLQDLHGVLDMVSAEQTEAVCKAIHKEHHNILLSVRPQSSHSARTLSTLHGVHSVQPLPNGARALCAVLQVMPKGGKHAPAEEASKRDSSHRSDSIDSSEMSAQMSQFDVLSEQRLVRDARPHAPYIAATCAHHPRARQCPSMRSMCVHAIACCVLVSVCGAARRSHRRLRVGGRIH
jgi:hypothetical protein